MAMQNFNSTLTPPDKNFKRNKIGFEKAVFCRFLEIFVFSYYGKPGLTDFSEQRVPSKAKYLLPECKIQCRMKQGKIHGKLVSSCPIS